jgi:hypothetical protein
VRNLELRWDAADGEDTGRFRSGRDLPSGEAVVRELEEFLRRSREQDGGRA